MVGRLTTVTALTIRMTKNSLVETLSGKEEDSLFSKERDFESCALANGNVGLKLGVDPAASKRSLLFEGLESNEA